MPLLRGPCLPRGAPAEWGLPRPPPPGLRGRGDRESPAGRPPVACPPLRGLVFVLGEREGARLERGAGLPEIGFNSFLRVPVALARTGGGFGTERFALSVI